MKNKILFPSKLIVWTFATLIIARSATLVWAASCDETAPDSSCPGDSSYSASCPDCIGCWCQTCNFCSRDTEGLCTGGTNCHYEAADGQSCNQYTLECQGDNCVGEVVVSGPYCGQVGVFIYDVDDCNCGA